MPKEDIISWKKSPFFPNLVDHLLVKHHTPEGVEDGISICYFKPYSQGRARWQGDTIHGVWFDEEPPYSIYGEGLTRTNKYGQFSILTFTPLMGMSDVVTKFLKNPSKSQKVVNMTIYDAEHYTDEQKEQIIASYPEHEREARARGIPTMGSVEYSRYRKRRLSASRLSVPITSMLSTLRTSAGTTRKLTFSFGGTKTQMFSIWRVYGRNQRTLPFRHGCC
ncbi:terminase large subunit domain-containing protein [Salmonella enterica]|uniref:terminase large subunit domain-containing protein n=1 Tax=Salmonella enterica TaxID=28901 RepID=UPI0035BE163D